MSHQIGLLFMSVHAGRLIVAPPWVIPIAVLLFLGLLAIAVRSGGEGG